MERAVHQLFAGRLVPEIVAEFGRALDIDEARLERWRRAYRQAGLDALTRLARDE